MAQVTPRQLFDSGLEAGFEMPGFWFHPETNELLLDTELGNPASLADVEAAVRDGLAKLDIHIGPMTERYRMVGWYAAELGPGDHGEDEWYADRFENKGYTSWAEAAKAACDALAKEKA